MSIENTAASLPKGSQALCLSSDALPTGPLPVVKGHRTMVSTSVPAAGFLASVAAVELPRIVTDPDRFPLPVPGRILPGSASLVLFTAGETPPARLSLSAAHSPRGGN